MRLRKRNFAILCATALATGIASIAAGDEVNDAVATLANVGPEGQGHREAQVAWKVAAAASPERLPELLKAIDTAGPLGRNWIRSAIESVVDQARASDAKLPLGAIEQFLRDVAHSPAARRLAFEILTQFEPSARDRLLADFLNDPSTELRREAIDRLLSESEKSGDQAGKTAALKRAFAASRDLDQIKEFAEKLEKLGEPVDLPNHFGFVARWKLIGPFDNAGEKGFDISYPPEQAVDTAQTYLGKEGKQVAWIDHTTTDKHGNVDLNAALGKNKGAVAYAFAEFLAAKTQTVDIRVGSNNAVKVWVNGKLYDSRKAYHSGFEIDQYVSQAELREGVNEILVKVCENEQTESWAQDWNFQLRVCDSVGTAVLSAERLAGR